jgi:hypothetical protein
LPRFEEEGTRARFLAEFTLSELQTSFAALRMTANGLGMTGMAFKWINDSMIQ